MPDSTSTLTTVFAATLVVLVLLEALWSWRGHRRVYSARETASNLVMMVVNQALKPLSVAWTLMVLSPFESMQRYRLPDTGWAFIITFVLADLAYYWQHRLMHVVPALWTMHHTHHSSPWMNLTTAVRLNWVAKFISPLFFTPLVLLGVSPAFLSMSLALGLLFQFLLHTEAVGRLGWFEGTLLNTPSAHRVHHGSNPRYIDKNFAGVFILWDRLFGTYEPEVEPVRYGVTAGFLNHNPLAAQLQPLWQYVRGSWRTEKEVVGLASSDARSGCERHRSSLQHVSP